MIIEEKNKSKEGKNKKRTNANHEQCNVGKKIQILPIKRCKKRRDRRPPKERHTENQKQIWSNGNVTRLILPNPVKNIGSALC